MIEVYLKLIPISQKKLGISFMSFGAGAREMLSSHPG
jgi:hypothetical protein